ncbi:MAG: hypothetical protein WCF93_02470 [Candidatus Moraniibacteriota bacterium]
MTDIQKITQSKYFKTIVTTLAILIAGAVIFAMGVHVGERRARYSYQWGANYERNFVGSPGTMMEGQRDQFGLAPMGPDGPIGMARNFGGQNFRNSHGIAGTIVSITENSIVIKDPSGKENTVAVSDKTLIKNGQADLKITDLKNDEKLVVIGNPGDNGVVNADLIRVFNNQ